MLLLRKILVILDGAALPLIQSEMLLFQRGFWLFVLLILLGLSRWKVN